MSNEHMPASTDTDKAAFSPDMAERAAARRREFAANRRAASEAWSKQKEAAGEAHREQDWLRLGGEQVDEAKARVEASELRLAYAKDDLMEKYLQHAEGDDASSPDVTVEDVMFEFAFKKSEIEAALSELQDRETRTPLDRERLTARIKAEQIKLDELVGAWHDIGGDAVDKTQEELVIAKAELASSEENVYAAMEARQAPKKEAKEPVVPAEPSPTPPGASNKSGKADKKQPTPQNGTPEPSNEASNESAKEQSPWAEVLDSDELSIEEVGNTLIAFMNSKYENLRQDSDHHGANKFLKEVLGTVDGYMHDRKSKKNAEWLEWDNQAKVTNLKNSLADYFKRLMREGNSAGEPGTDEAQETKAKVPAETQAEEFVQPFIDRMRSAPMVSRYASPEDYAKGRLSIYYRAMHQLEGIEDEQVYLRGLELLQQAYAELITTTGVGLGSLEQPKQVAPDAGGTPSAGSAGRNSGQGDEGLGLFRPRRPSEAEQGEQGEADKDELPREIREYVERLRQASSKHELESILVEASELNNKIAKYDDGSHSRNNDALEQAYEQNSFSKRKVITRHARTIGHFEPKDERVQHQSNVNPDFRPASFEDSPYTERVRQIAALGSRAFGWANRSWDSAKTWLGIGVEPAKPADKQTHR